LELDHFLFDLQVQSPQLLFPRVTVVYEYFVTWTDDVSHLSQNPIFVLHGTCGLRHTVAVASLYTIEAMTRSNRASSLHLMCASFLILWLSLASALAPQNGVSRRSAMEIAGWTSLVALSAPSVAENVDVAEVAAVEVAATGDARKLFNEGRALESQGNMAAAQRLYAKVTKISPKVRRRSINCAS
jgi:hypothetical protein